MSTNTRPDKDQYYLTIALAVSMRSTCLRRHYGSVIVKNDHIVSTGYNGAPRGCINCSDIGECIRIKKQIAHNTDYTDCKAVHSEQNAIIQANHLDLQDATLYLAGHDVETGQTIDYIDCCPLCKRMIINSGIKTVIMLQHDQTAKIVPVSNWIHEMNHETKLRMI